VVSADRPGAARLLIVEDDRAIRELLADRLRPYELVFSACQEDCFEQLDATELDLVLLDLRLPRTPGDMAASNEVGLDILRQIRTRGLRKRGSTMVLPVVVMTAYGSEAITAKVLIECGANDYIPKPFRQGDDLERKIERALHGAGALVPAANSAASTVCVHFDPRARLVRIESIPYAEHYDLMKVLIDAHAKDLADLRPWDDYTAIPGRDLAQILGIGEKALRQRVSRFRDVVAADLRDQLGRAIGPNDIIENQRRWKGYRLNPRTVRVFRQGAGAR
jgi:DNA-binding response OmpR family regulator